MSAAHHSTKIVCTIGPSSESVSKLKQLIRAGMRIARLNFSHGDTKGHSQLISNIRQAAEETNIPVAILGDLPGVKLRLGDIGKVTKEFRKGQSLHFSLVGESQPEQYIFPIALGKFANDLKVGQHILMGDGTMEVQIARKTRDRITVKALTPGIIRSRRGVNIPELKSSNSIITKRDIEFAIFAVQKKVDYLAMSFVRSEKDIQELRRLITRHEGASRKVPIKIIAKIEKPDAVEDIQDIIKEADGIMVARGDLGVETPFEEVPVVQKQIIEQCRVAAKPVITATQMLISMVSNPRPTRPEVSDVANAVIDHTDAVMLSDETAIGQYPVEAVRAMSSIIKVTEESPYDDVVPGDLDKHDHTEGIIAQAVARLAEEVDAKFILVASRTGDTARSISSYRSEVPVYAVARDKRTEHQLQLNWGVRPLYIDPPRDNETLAQAGKRALTTQGFAKKGDFGVIITQKPKRKQDITRVIKIEQL